MRTRALRCRPELPSRPPAARTPPPAPPSADGIRSPSPAALLFMRGRDADGRLRELEAQRARARPVLGALAARFLDARGSEALGFRSVGDWSRERLGVGARAVREWARVWRRLEALPLLRRAVLDGEVLWSVARLVVSRATPENEADCLATVRGRTLRAVKAMLRAVDASAEAAGAAAADADAPGEEEEHVRVRATGPPELAGRWAFACELARRMAGEALPVWACAEAMAAEAASRWGGPETETPVHRWAPAARGKRGADDREHGLRHVLWPQLPWGHPCALKPSRIECLAGGAAGCSSLELDARLRAATAFLQSLDLETGRLLRQVLERGLHREMGFERYVAERLDIAPRTARRLVALAREEGRTPRIAQAFRAGHVTAFQAEVLGRVAAGDEAHWLARAARVTLRRLEDDAAAVPRAAVAFRAPPDVAAFFAAMVRRAGGLAALLDHVIATWLAAGDRFTGPREYADFERDGWRCTVPGCTARRNLHGHHVRFRSAGGPDESWNRTTLCAWHHQRGVHTGLIRIAGRAPAGLLYELGVGRFRSGDRIVGRRLLVDLAM
jgi:hypothetical protein